MIGTCTKCGSMFETSEEDANTPGMVCVTCHNRECEARESLARLTPIERATLLKATRRAELQRQAEESARLAAEWEAGNEANLRQTVAVFLKNNDAVWLAEFQTRIEAEDFGNPPNRRVFFEVPGHRAIFLRFEVITNHHSGPSPQTWRTAYHRDGHKWHLLTRQGWDGWPTLAEALIAAEIGTAEEEARNAAAAADEPIPF